MNHRLQLSPTPSPPRSNARSRLSGRWGATLAKREDAKFFRSWLVYDSDLDATRTRGRFNWDIIAGLILMVLISAAGWWGISLLFRHFLK
jgi:hypothetical protein